MFERNTLPLKQTTNQDHQKNTIDFYRLHYPNKHSPIPKQKSFKARSKSVLSVMQSAQNEQTNNYNPKGSMRKHILNRDTKDTQITKQKNKFQEIVPFKVVLHAKSQQSELSGFKYAFNNLKEVEQLAKKNNNVRLVFQKTKEEKIKMSKMVLSHKQNQQYKLEYLRQKNRDIKQQIDEEMHSIYEQFFMKEYEALYGKQIGRSKFNSKITNLVETLSDSIFKK